MNEAEPVPERPGADSGSAKAAPRGGLSHFQAAVGQAHAPPKNSKPCYDVVFGWLADPLGTTAKAP